MFLNSRIFKKIITEAWKGQGLRIGKQMGYFFLSGGYWLIKIKADTLANKEKAAIIELMGELPDDGIIFESKKECANQYELTMEPFSELDEAFETASVEFNITKISLQQGGMISRILQNEFTQEAKLINEVFVNMIDPSAMDRNIETEPTGPLALRENGGAYCWKNEVCKLIAYGRQPKEESYEEAFLKLLENMELRDKK